jgi:hypothetical protein
MHAWLSLEAFAASFTTSGGFCAGAALVKEKRRNPKIMAEWRVPIAPPVLVLGLSKVIVKWGEDPRIVVAPIFGYSFRRQPSSKSSKSSSSRFTEILWSEVLCQPVKMTRTNDDRSGLSPPLLTNKVYR